MSFIEQYETQLVAAGHRRIERRLRNRVARWLGTPRRRGAAVVIAALVIGAPATAATVGWNPFDEPNRDPRVGTPSLSEGPPDAALVRMLGVLRRPQTPAERRFVERQLRTEGGLRDVAGVHVDYIRVLDFGRGVTLIPVDRFGLSYERAARGNPSIPPPNRAALSDAVCVYDPGGGAVGQSCFTAARIRSGFAISTGPESGIGMVPDGVERVRLADGERSGQAPVRDNLFITGGEAPVAPMIVEWLDDRGEVVKRIDLSRPTP